MRAIEVVESLKENKMRYKIASVLVLGAVLMLSLNGAQAASIKWAKSFSDAMAQARKSHKLIMADFFTDWCVWCKRLDADVYTDASVVKLSGQLVAVKVNAEKEGVQQARHYEVQGYPMILFLNEKGEVEGRIGGYLPAKGFSEQMSRFLTGHTAYPALQDKVRKNPGDLNSLAKLASLAATRGDTAQAETLVAHLQTADPKNSRGFLAMACNDLGSSYLERDQFAKAIPYFAKSVKYGKMPKDVAAAHLKMAICYLSQNKIKAGIPELKAAAAVPGCPADIKAEAQRDLGIIKAQGLDKK
jgi:thioredoxin-related protein